MASERKWVLLVISLIASASCQPTPSPVFQYEDDSAKQAATGIGALLAPLATMMLQPLLSNVATALTNAITATLGNRQLSIVPVDSLDPNAIRDTIYYHNP